MCVCVSIKSLHESALEVTTGAAVHTWMKNYHDGLSSLDLGIHEARDLVQNRPLRRLISLHSVMVHATIGLDESAHRFSHYCLSNLSVGQSCLRFLTVSLGIGHSFTV